VLGAGGRVLGIGYWVLGSRLGCPICGEKALGLYWIGSKELGNRSQKALKIVDGG